MSELSVSEHQGADLHQRVDALMERPGFRALFDRVRARLEVGGRPETMTLRGLDRDARGALADLLGMARRPDADVRVNVEELDRALRASRVGAGLVEVLEADGGPLANRRAERADREAAWHALRLEIHTEPLVQSDVGLYGWEDYLFRGTLRRLTGDVEHARRLVNDALTVIARLPADGIPLAVLSADVTGDPHALDPGQPLSTITLAGIAAMERGDATLPTRTRDRRELWLEVGVLCDPLSSNVLVLGLRPAGPGLLDRTLHEHADAGEPVRLTLRQLGQHDVEIEPATVRICENPAVLAWAADELADGCQPLVCVEGVPDTAADLLLRSLARRGCDLAFHADFDRGGVRIGNLIVSRYGARPWRFGAADYRSALDRLDVTAVLGGPPDRPEWDDELGEAMRERGRAVAEEQVLDDLLVDLA